MNQWRKALCVLLALFLICSNLPLSVLAEGDSDQIVVIESIDEFSQTEDENGPLGDEDEEPEEADEDPDLIDEEQLPEPMRAYPEVSLPIPLFLQTDYSDTKYGSGTVATSGCAMACAAMLITYFSGETVEPDELAVRFRDYEASNLQRMEAAAIVHDLTFSVTLSWGDVIQALCAGKPVVILVGSKSSFTRTQHLLLLTGITSDGRILVNEPYGPNYQKAELINGFRDGFTQDFICKGFSGAWIFDQYEAPANLVTRYPTIQLTQEERDLLAKIIWLEARGESFEGQVAVAEVVFNRMVAERFPTNTLEGTIMAEGQFRTAKLVDRAKPGELQYKAIDRALSGPYQLPMDAFYFARYQPNTNFIARIGRHIFCGPV